MGPPLVPDDERDDRLMLLDRNISQLVIVDVQERLVPAIHEGEKVVENGLRLVTAAAELGIPTTLAEQYVSGLGPTVEPLRKALAHATRFEKLSFSCKGDPDLAGHIGSLAEGGRRQILLAGLEAHVCVLQTALGFAREGFAVSVVSDAVGSRSPASVAAASARLLHAGCQWVTTEMVLFEWLERAGTDDFRALLPLIK